MKKVLININNNIFLFIDEKDESEKDLNKNKKVSKNKKSLLSKILKSNRKNKKGISIFSSFDGAFTIINKLR